MLVSYPKNFSHLALLSGFKRGFTLVEIVMVLLIVGIISIVAVPKFFVTSQYNQRVYFDAVLNTLRYAQKLSVGTGCQIQVAFSGNALQLTQRTGTCSGSPCCTAGTFTQAVFDPANNSTPYSKTAPTGITVTTSGNWPLYFNALGQARQISNDAVANFTITVGGVTINTTGETGYTQ